MSWDDQGRRCKCDFCGRFMRLPYDSRTVFGCADPGAPEPYDPDDYCKKCAKENFEHLLARYKCCRRDGDWEKSNAEIRAAKEAGLVWITNSGFNSLTGAYIHQQYLSQWDLKYFVEYLEYEKKRRDENRCKCWRVKDADGNCPQCSRPEVYCMCRYYRDMMF